MEKLSNKKILAAIVGLTVTGVGLFYFLRKTKKKEVVRVLEKEELKKILISFDMEYSNMYHRWCLSKPGMLKAIKTGANKEKALEKQEEELRKISEMSDQKMFETFNITSDTFTKSMDHHSSEEFVIDFKQSTLKNYHKLMEGERPEFSYSYPKEITSEKLLEVYRVSYLKFRFDLFQKVQSYLANKSDQTVPQSVAHDLIKDWKLPKIKERVFKILSLPIVEGESIIVTIEKADMMLTQDKKESFSSDLIKLQDEHKTLLDLVKSGQKLDGMTEDPLEEYQNKIRLEQEKIKQEQEEAKKELLRKENEAKHEEEKTALGFMGNQEDQQKLVEEVRANMRKQSEEKQAEQNLGEPADIEAKPESNS